MSEHRDVMEEAKRLIDTVFAGPLDWYCKTKKLDRAQVEAMGMTEHLETGYVVFTFPDGSCKGLATPYTPPNRPNVAWGRVAGSGERTW